MKKILLLCVLVCLVVGCSKKPVDPLVGYRDKTSTQLFNDGERALAKGSYSVAVKNFEALDAIYPFGPYAEQGQLDIIYAYYKDGDDASAMVAADRYTRLYPRGAHVDYAFYMRGIVGFNEGLSWLQKAVGVDPAPRDISTLQQSYAAFAMVVHQFPNSLYYSDSLTRMAYIRNLLARREVMIAEFYLEHQAYVAAANRATYVVQHFQGSPQVINALVVMVKAYRALDLEEMANKTYAILQTNYPNTKQFRDLSKT